MYQYACVRVCVCVCVCVCVWLSEYYQLRTRTFLFLIVNKFNLLCAVTFQISIAFMRVLADLRNINTIFAIPRLVKVRRRLGQRWLVYGAPGEATKLVTWYLLGEQADYNHHYQDYSRHNERLKKLKHKSSGEHTRYNVVFVAQYGAMQKNTTQYN